MIDVFVQCMRVGSITTPIPTYAKPGDSGLDLSAAIAEPWIILPGTRALIPTGWAFELPHGLEGQVRPRSGLSFRRGLVAVFGTVDSGYRGQVSVNLANIGAEPQTIQPGDRIAQFVIAPVMRAALAEVATLGETERGAGGFGSTGTGVRHGA
jgi:dUTP pyrophosphatase